jgi:hypothetical protein
LQGFVYKLSLTIFDEMMIAIALIGSTFHWPSVTVESVRLTFSDTRVVDQNRLFECEELDSRDAFDRLLRAKRVGETVKVVTRIEIAAVYFDALRRFGRNGTRPTAPMTLPNLALLHRDRAILGTFLASCSVDGEKGRTGID